MFQTIRRNPATSLAIGRKLKHKIKAIAATHL